MKCPACDKDLYIQRWRTMDLDICGLGCEGIWFDGNELDRVSNAKIEQVADAALSGILFKPYEGNDAPIRLCPRTSDPMGIFEINLDVKIIVDICPKCHGIWMDKGELETYASQVKLLSLEQEYPEPAQLQPQPQVASVESVTRPQLTHMTQSQQKDDTDFVNTAKPGVNPWGGKTPATMMSEEEKRLYYPSSSSPNYLDSLLATLHYFIPQVPH